MDGHEGKGNLDAIIELVWKSLNRKDGTWRSGPRDLIDDVVQGREVMVTNATTIVVVNDVACRCVDHFSTSISFCLPATDAKGKADASRRRHPKTRVNH